MIIVGAHEGADRDDAVTARTVLDHHRLSPARAQPLPDEARPDVDSRAGSERHYEFDRTLRPRLFRRWRRRQQSRCDETQGKGKQSWHAAHHLPPIRAETIARHHSHLTL